MALIKKISVTWCIEDVLSVRPHFTKLQASEVLKFIDKNHDANNGINWEVIENACDALFFE